MADGTEDLAMLTAGRVLPRPFAGAFLPMRLCRLRSGRLPCLAAGMLLFEGAMAQLMITGPMVRRAAHRTDHNVIARLEGLAAHRAFYAEISIQRCISSLAMGCRYIRIDKGIIYYFSTK